MENGIETATVVHDSDLEVPVVPPEPVVTLVDELPEEETTTL